MFKKELRHLGRNYGLLFFIVFAPALLTFIMGQGTMHYNPGIGQTVRDLGARIQVLNLPRITSTQSFAISATTFFAMMLSNFIAHDLYQERENRTLDRHPSKARLLMAKGLLYAAVLLLMILISGLTNRLFYGIQWTLPMIGLFWSTGFLSIPFGFLIALKAHSKQVLSNIALMIVMLLGYFSGTLSLMSVLKNTPIMRRLIYISPLTWLNEALTHRFLGVADHALLPWLIYAGALLAVMCILINRSLHHD